MRNQFFYTRKVQKQLEGTEGVENVVTSSYRDSLNLDMVIRSVTLETGEVVVLLNDMHEQTQQYPIVNEKTKKVTYKEAKSIVQSEITLSVEDGKRFFEATSVDYSKPSYSEERAGILEKSNSSDFSGLAKMAIETE